MDAIANSSFLNLTKTPNIFLSRFWNLTKASPFSQHRSWAIVQVLSHCQMDSVQNIGYSPSSLENNQISNGILQGSVARRPKQKKVSRILNLNTFYIDKL